MDVPESTSCDGEKQTDSSAFEKKCGLTQTESSKKIQKRLIGTYHNYYGTIKTKEETKQKNKIFPRGARSRTNTHNVGR